MNQDASSPTRCPKCGAAVPKNAAHGLCPRCVFAKAVAVTGGPAIDPPDVASVRAAFPHLEVLSLIGAGGMGAVFKARQPQLDRVVALKLLVSEQTDEDRFAERFQREAQALARLSHPHIVTIHDFGKAGGFYYLLMEYVDGVNLRQATAAGRLAPEQALAVVPPICEALQYAHERGIVHRDIKPENLLLDRRGVLKIADFGIARILGAIDSAPDSSATSGNLTHVDTLGTPSYMAPEQRTAPATVDHRADIYSLGVVLYELLTGELPKHNIEPPSGKVQIDVRLDEIVLRALSETPERRYNTALEFKTQLAAVTSQVPDAEQLSPAPLQNDQLKDEQQAMARKTWRASRPFLGASAALLMLAAICVAPWLLLPPEYFAKVTLETEQQQVGYPSAGRYKPAQYDPAFYEMEMQRMRKTAVLGPVIRQLGLVMMYSQNDRELQLEEVYQLLGRDIDTKHIRNTGLIEVGVYNTDPQLAERTANAIAVSYRRQQIEDVQRLLEFGNYQAKEFLSQVRKTANNDMMNMAQLREQTGLVDSDPESVVVAGQMADGANSSADVEEYANMKGRYISAKKLLEAAELEFAQARINQEIGSEPVRIWQSAEIPSSPIPFSPKRLIVRVKRWFAELRG